MIDQFPRDPSDIHTGEIRFSGAEHLSAAVANAVARAQRSETYERQYTVPEAIEVAKSERLQSFAAVGRVASLARIDIVHAEMSLRNSDAQTMREARGSFIRMKDMFFAKALPQSVTDFTPAQRRQIAMRTSVGRSDLYDTNGRGEIRRR